MDDRQITETNFSRTLLFLGDCNTRGADRMEGNAYPEQLAAEKPHWRCINCGHTMSTVREGYHYFEVYSSEKPDAVCIQYGLVDSWLTFRYSPYVLYYPDNRWRKIGRKLVKKFKKWCKALGLNSLLGTRNVVPAHEYKATIEQMIQTVHPKPVILIETVPNEDKSRNPAIRQYNQVLAELAQTHQNCTLVPLYDFFEKAGQRYYSDATHLSAQGHQEVATRLKDILEGTL